MMTVGTQGSKQVLMENGKAVILLAGEVHNSDSSSPEYMEKIWETAEHLGMNALLLPVSWEMTEPEEDKFDFSVPARLIDQARERKMRIVFLWFGSWKNAECMYAPEWVKRDTKRFPRAQIEKGKNKAGRTVSPTIPVRMPYTSLSYLGTETARADAAAFAALMRFLKEYDGERQTVAAVQVENETGLLGAGREHSDAADRAFAEKVPEDFAATMQAHADTMTEDMREAVLGGRKEGTWEEVFGTAAEEIFSAYHIAGYVERVAAAGKAEYPLPMAVNCWLDKGGAPGTFPTGGPVSRVREVWRCQAPSIDLYAPDIYVPDFREVCGEYTRRGEALFIPETATHSYCAPRLVWCIGHHHAACYSPFGFDDIGKPFSATQAFLFGVDVTDPALKTPQDAGEYAALCRTLRAMEPMLTEAYGSNRLQAVSAETDPPAPHPSGNPMLARGPEMVFDSFRLQVRFQGPTMPRNDGCCLCLQTAENECWIVGNACGISFLSAREDRSNLDFTCVEEGCFDEKGDWKPGRRLNGDETASLALNQPTVLKVRFILYGDE